MTDRISIKSEGRAFLPCPAGLQQAVCVDVIDLGQTVEQYQQNPPKLTAKMALVFQSSEVNEETGKRFEPSIELTASFGQTAKLRKLLGNWRGKPYGDEDREAFEQALNHLGGVNAMLNIVHKTSNQGRTYAVIESINPLPKNTKKIAADGYVRSEHWARRKEDYQRKAIDFLESHAPSESYDEMPQAIQNQDDDLPF